MDVNDREKKEENICKKHLYRADKAVVAFSAVALEINNEEMEEH